jgi:uncharacterized protein
MATKKIDYAGAEQYILQLLDKRLPKDLFYHGLHHTRDVYGAALLIAQSEKVSPDELNLLKIATLFHDAGFINHYKNHEEAGCKLAQKLLPDFGFNASKIQIIEGMIMATKIPQSPKNKLERIICDADLDYLGREDFKDIAKTLFDELKVYMNVKDETTWNKIQVNFLKGHRYHTAFSRRTRESNKQLHLHEIIKIVEDYDTDRPILSHKDTDKAKADKKVATKAAADKKVSTKTIAAKKAIKAAPMTKKSVKKAAPKKAAKGKK